jgi:hypothetical protein
MLTLVKMSKLPTFNTHSDSENVEARRLFFSSKDYFILFCSLMVDFFLFDHEARGSQLAGPPTCCAFSGVAISEGSLSLMVIHHGKNTL